MVEKHGCILSSIHSSILYVVLRENSFPDIFRNTEARKHSLRPRIVVCKNLSSSLLIVCMWYVVTVIVGMCRVQKGAVSDPSGRIHTSSYSDDVTLAGSDAVF